VTIAGNPLTKLRAQLAKRINEQIHLVHQHGDGPLPQKSWAWLGDAGSYFVGVRYGHRPIELKKGMFAVECDDLPAIANTLGHLRELILNGGLDEPLMKTSREIRARFLERTKRA
jgi:hypothetical protein